MDGLDGAAPPLGPRIEGYASLFDRADLSGDIVRRGAFTRSLLDAPADGIRMLYQHEAGEPVGVWEAVFEDQTGLFVRGRMLPAGARGRAAARLVQSRAVDGLSIGYRVRRAEKRRDGVRELIDVELWEVSIVTFPMLPQARLRVIERQEAREREPALMRA